MRIISVYIGLIAAMLWPLAGVASAASTPSMYFAQSSIQTHKGGDFSLQLHIDGHGTHYNTASVVVHFPANQLSFVSFVKASTYFDTVLPATPKVVSGTLEFSVASLSNGSTSGDETIGTLVFKANVSGGSATINLNGSQAANGGAAIPVTAYGSSITFSGTSSGPTVSLSLGTISVTDITVNNGVVHWNTNVPATSSVDYGVNDKYGFTAGSLQLVTQHAIRLDQVFGGKAAVHFRVMSTDAQVQSVVSEDQTFTTRGYTIQVSATDKQGNALPGASVSVAGAKAVKANKHGVALVQDVAPGVRQVVVNGGPGQYITVKALTGKAAASTQKFTLTAGHAPIPLWYYLAGLIILVVAYRYLKPRKKKKTKQNTTAPTQRTES